MENKNFINALDDWGSVLTDTYDNYNKASDLQCKIETGITGGGIKLADTIQNSPDLKEHVLQNIDRVRDWLKANGIMDSDDMNN